jgi:hypothetical protein
MYTSTSGSATTSSTLTTFNQDNANGAFVAAQASQVEKPFSSATNVTLSILLAVTKAGGTGTHTIQGSSILTEVWVEAAGPALPNTAVAL